MWKSLMSVIVMTVFSSLSFAQTVKEDRYVDQEHRIHYSVISVPEWMDTQARKDDYKRLRSGLGLLEILKGTEDELGDEYDGKIQYDSRYNPLGKIYTVRSSSKEVLYVTTIVSHPLNAIYVGNQKNDLSGWTLSCISTKGKYSRDIKSMIFSPVCQKAINKYKIPLKKADLSKFSEVKGSLN